MLIAMREMNFRAGAVLGLCSFFLIGLGKPAAGADELTWTDAASLTIHGRGWDDVASPFHRLPARAEGIVRPEVWALSKDAAGLYVEFAAETTEIAVRWDLMRERLFMHHMPSSGVSGLDLYVWDDRESRWRWLANGRPGKQAGNEQVLVREIPLAERRYRLYLPLYNGVDSLRIGARGELRDSARDERNAVLIYGTSIVQGASASRPGMAYPALLGRHLDRTVINLGFSGNGRAEPEVAELLTELDPALFVLDPLPNLSGPTVTPLVEKFIGILRSSHPTTPIVLVESIVYTNAHLVPSREERHSDSSRQMRDLWERLSLEDPNLHLLPAERLFGGDEEDTVDGTHPNDLGFFRMAEGMLPFIAQLLRDEPVAGAPALQEANHGEVRQMSSRQAAARLSRGNAVLVDVREPEEWEGGVAAPAVLLPLSDLRGSRDAWRPFLESLGGRELILYCRSGNRSGIAADLLAGEGFSVANAGSFEQWQAAGLPHRQPEQSAPITEAIE